MSIWDQRRRRPRCENESPPTSRPAVASEIRELPCESGSWTRSTARDIGPARIRAASVTHRGPTLGYRSRGRHLALSLPRPRAALGHDIDDLDRDRDSGYDLACELAVDPRQPVHADEYPDTSVGGTPA